MIKISNTKLIVNDIYVIEYAEILRRKDIIEKLYNE